MESNKRYFHYTPETRLEEIIQSEKIKLATVGIDNKKEKPCAWVSTNPKWEPTATKMYRNQNGEILQFTFSEQLKNLGCARIEVEPIGLFPWKTVVKLSKMKSKDANNMETSGIEMGGNPSEWFGSFSPIDINRWIRAEVYRDGEWIEYDVFEEEEI
jgi:hypothetical protein